MAAEYEYIPIVYKNNNNKAQYIHKYNNRAENRRRYTESAVYGANRNAADSYARAAYAYTDTAYPGSYAKPTQKIKKAGRSKGVFSAIMVIVVVFLMLTLVLAGNTQISSMNFANSELSKEINTLQQEIDDLKLEITLGQDLGYIQERAAEMGMHSPDAHQVVYL